jgi:integrase
MWFELEAYQSWDMTEKNLALVRQVLVPGIWRRVVALPAELMLEARKNRSQSPIKAAVQAQMACAIAILLVAPIRLGNLASIKLDTHLLRPGGTDAPYWLHFPRYDVKNRVRLEFPLDERVTALVEEYVNDFLPTLRRGSNEPYLFPGETGGHKGKATLSAQISQRILKATGLRVTVHQFRHAAAALFLQQHPGCYERVRQLLGHKTLATTTKFYIALQTTGPGEMLADIVWSHLEFKVQMPREIGGTFNSTTPRKCLAKPNPTAPSVRPPIVFPILNASAATNLSLPSIVVSRS